MAKQNSDALGKIVSKTDGWHHTVHRNGQNYSLGNLLGSRPTVRPLLRACAICLTYIPSCICSGWVIGTCTWGLSWQSISFRKLALDLAGTGTMATGSLSMLMALPSELSSLDPCNQGNNDSPSPLSHLQHGTQSCAKSSMGTFSHQQVNCFVRASHSFSLKVFPFWTAKLNRAHYLSMESSLSLRDRILRTWEG